MSKKAISTIPDSGSPRGFKDFIYFFMRVYSQFICRLMVKNQRTEGLQNVNESKPIIFASTHFNSFLDAILVHNTVQPKVFALARGDAFKNKWVAKVLDLVYILPIWRISEGKSNMIKNEATFERCHRVLNEYEKVYICPEGVCKNQREVLPLKKSGISGMAFRAWQAGLDVEVVPAVQEYDQYHQFGKLANVSFNKPLKASDFDLSDEKIFAQQFSQVLHEKMQEVVYQKFESYNFFKNPIYALGWLFNFPYYLAIDPLLKKKFAKTVFYDSVWYAALYIGLPLYWLIVGIIFCIIY